MEYKKAGMEDIELLCELRRVQLIHENGHPETEIKSKS